MVKVMQDPLLDSSPRWQHGVSVAYPQVRPWSRARSTAVPVLLLLLACWLVMAAVSMAFMNQQEHPTKYVLVIDSGSSGTRIYAYNWTVPGTNQGSLPVVQAIPPAAAAHLVPKKTSKGMYNRVETQPGLDAFVDDPTGLSAAALGPLLAWARGVVPASQQSSSPLFLLGTGGLRRLEPHARNKLMANTRTLLAQSGFRFQDSWAKVISGTEEGVYGWLALNYEQGMLAQHAAMSAAAATRTGTAAATPVTLGVLGTPTSVGALDMGGSSLEMTFEVPVPGSGSGSSSSSSGYNAPPVSALHNITVADMTFHLHTHTFKHYGLNEAYDRAVTLLLQEQQKEVQQQQQQQQQGPEQDQQQQIQQEQQEGASSALPHSAVAVLAHQQMQADLAVAAAAGLHPKPAPSHDSKTDDAGQGAQVHINKTSSSADIVAHLTQVDLAIAAAAGLHPKPAAAGDSTPAAPAADDDVIEAAPAAHPFLVNSSGSADIAAHQMQVDLAVAAAAGLHPTPNHHLGNTSSSLPASAVQQEGPAGEFAPEQLGKHTSFSSSSASSSDSRSSAVDSGVAAAAAQGEGSHSSSSSASEAAAGSLLEPKARTLSQRVDVDVSSGDHRHLQRRVVQRRDSRQQQRQQQWHERRLLLQQHEHLRFSDELTDLSSSSSSNLEQPGSIATTEAAQHLQRATSQWLVARLRQLLLREFPAAPSQPEQQPDDQASSAVLEGPPASAAAAAVSTAAAGSSTSSSSTGSGSGSRSSPDSSRNGSSSVAASQSPGTAAAGGQAQPVAADDRALPVVWHPCLHEGFAAKYERTAYGGMVPNPAQVLLRGRPSWAGCQVLADYLVNASAPCQVSQHRPVCRLGTPQPELQGNFLALTGFYVVSKFLEVPSGAPLGAFLDAAKELCAKPWSWVHDTLGQHINVERYCTWGPYTVKLLRHGLHLQDKDVRIGSGDVGWPLGAALSEASKLPDMMMGVGKAAAAAAGRDVGGRHSVHSIHSVHNSVQVGQPAAAAAAAAADSGQGLGAGSKQEGPVDDDVGQERLVSSGTGAGSSAVAAAVTGSSTIQQQHIEGLVADGDDANAHVGAWQYSQRRSWAQLMWGRHDHLHMGHVTAIFFSVVVWLSVVVYCVPNRLMHGVGFPGFSMLPVPFRGLHGPGKAQHILPVVGYSRGRNSPSPNRGGVLKYMSS